MKAGKSDDADDMITMKDFLRSPEAKENPRTKLDVLACVGSFALERCEQKKKLDDDPPLPPRSVKNCFLYEVPKKKRSCRGPSLVGSESDLLIQEPTLKKLKEVEDFTASDLGIGSLKRKPKNEAISKPPVHRRTSSCKNDAFLSMDLPVGPIDPIERMIRCDGQKKRSRRPNLGSELDLNQEPPPEKESFTAYLGLGPELALTQDPQVVPVSLKKPKNEAINVPVKRRKKPCPNNINDAFVSSSRVRDMPVGLKDQIERMNGYDILFLVEKALTESDVKSSLSRLMMPVCRMMNNFLTDEEYTFLKVRVGNEVNGLDVSLIIIHPLRSGQEGKYCSSKVTLRRCEKKQSIGYVLNTGWNDVVFRNQLKSGNVIQVWSFRVEHKLHLALVLL